MYYVPDEHQDAELLAEQISIRLQHSNSAVVLTTVKVILYLMNYMGSQVIVNEMCRKLSPPLGAQDWSDLLISPRLIKHPSLVHSHSPLFGLRSTIRRFTKHLPDHSTKTIGAQERRQSLLLQVQRSDLRQTREIGDHLSVGE